MKYLTVIFILMSFNAKAQTGADSTFFSRLYLPFGGGTSMTDDSKTYSGMVLLTGFEYRFRKTNGLLFRFNYDYRLQRYRITGSPDFNVSNGKLEFTDYLAGIGYRLGKGRVRTFGLMQGGMTSYKFLQVTGTENNYKLSEVRKGTPAFRGTAGMEFYFNPNVALTFESSYTLIPSNAVFWGNGLNILEFSIGLTTTLF
jgi:hypothetical protein